MTPHQIRRFGVRALTRQIRLFGVPARVGWEGEDGALLDAMVSPISRRESFAPGTGFQGEHDGSAIWPREDPATGDPLPVPAVGQVFSFGGSDRSYQVYRIDEVVDNPVAPHWQVGLTAI